MFIRTKRLLLRPLWPEDARALAHALNDEAIAKNLATVPHPYRRADADYYIARSLASALPQPTFAIIAVTNADQPLIGGIAISNSAELGYWIARDFWNNGYASEAATAVLDLAFFSLRLKDITASSMIGNEASAHVLAQKLGFAEAALTEFWCDARQRNVPARKFTLDHATWLARRSPAPHDQMLAA